MGTRSIWYIVLCTSLGFAACTKPSGQQPSTVTQDSLQGPPPSDVLFSFAFMGCNRIDGKDVNSPYTNASTANVPQLQRTLAQIAALKPQPAFFFFLGDLVLGLDSTSTVLNDELSAWVSQYQDPKFNPINNTPIQLVAMPGNHEMLFMQEIPIPPLTEPETEKNHHHFASIRKREVPWQDAIDAWMNQMEAFMPAFDLNRVSGPDSLANRQTYSFDFSNTHFTILNTDTWNPALQIGTFPVDWVIQDLKKARSNPNTEHIFLLSHKPAFVEPDHAEDALMDTTQRNQLWTAMAEYRAEALLSAHSHQYYRCQPQSGSSYQVVAGNAGSPYESDLDTCQQFMGFSVVYVLKSGDIVLQSFGRDVPTNTYLEQLPAGLATTTRDSVSIRWGSKAGLWNCAH